MIRIAEYRHRIEPLLHARDLAADHAAEHFHAPVGRAEALPRSVGDRPLSLPRHVVAGLHVDAEVVFPRWIEGIGRVFIGTGNLDADLLVGFDVTWVLYR